jgi:hypothetical protein
MSVVPFILDPLFCCIFFWVEEGRSICLKHSQHCLTHCMFCYSKAHLYWGFSIHQLTKKRSFFSWDTCCLLLFVPGLNDSCWQSSKWPCTWCPKMAIHADMFGADLRDSLRYPLFCPFLKWKVAGGYIKQLKGFIGYSPPFLCCTSEEIRQILFKYFDSYPKRNIISHCIYLCSYVWYCAMHVEYIFAWQMPCSLDPNCHQFLQVFLASK